MRAGELCPTVRTRYARRRRDPALAQTSIQTILHTHSSTVATNALIVETKCRLDLVDARQNAGAGLRRRTRHLEAMPLARSSVEYQIGKRPADIGSKKAAVGHVSSREGAAAGWNRR